MATAERDLLAAADLTIVTAPRLLELKRPLRPPHRTRPQRRRLRSLPTRPAPPAQTLHNSKPLAPSPQSPVPIIGYSGHISSRLDLPLLREMALARPDWQFVFAGSEGHAAARRNWPPSSPSPTSTSWACCRSKTCRTSSPRCDVCLIPYRVNDETRAISSLKLYEYLAAGKPVVSARVPAAEEHAAVVRIAEGTVESWVSEIEAALAERDDPVQVAARARPWRRGMGGRSGWGGLEVSLSPSGVCGKL